MLPLWVHDQDVSVESVEVQLLLEWFERDETSSPIALNKSLRPNHYLTPSFSM